MGMSNGTFLARRTILATGLLSLVVGGAAQAQTDPLPSWNDGNTKKAIIDFVRATTTQGMPTLVQPAGRLATFDQDGTLWVEKPMYTQVIYCLERIPALVKARPELADVEPFKTVMSGDREAITRLPTDDLEKILALTLTGLSVDEFKAEVSKWLDTARDPRWKRPYRQASAHQRGEAAAERQLRRQPESIHLMIGRRPLAAFGNSTGGREMLEHAKTGSVRAFPCCCCTTMPRASTPTVRRRGCRRPRSAPSPSSYDEAKSRDWTVISMKNDWKRIFPFE